MEFSTHTGDPAQIKTGCLVVGIFAKRKLSDGAKQLDEASDGALAQALKHGDLQGESGQTLLLYSLPRIKAPRILLVGCGERKEYTAASLRKVAATAAAALDSGGAGSALLLTGGLLPDGAEVSQCCRDVAIATMDAVYRFDELKSDPKRPKRPLKKLGIHLADESQAEVAGAGLTQGLAIGHGMGLAKDLGNRPGNVCTPSYLADVAERLASDHERLKLEVLDEKRMEKLGMGSLLSVSRGSSEPAKLIVLSYSGAAADQKPVVLVGKGLTFDAGGISIKPAAAMDEMKYDMSGGASVLGTLAAVAELGLPINVVGVIPASENLPDGSANKPGDIVKSMSGQTIEILNTDAEGRLILCDALTYSERFKPAAVIDIATLTGAVVIALGKHASGLMSNDDALAQALLDAGESTGDRAWRLPLWEDYQSQLDSNFADMANVGGREAGSITAACFLARFTKKYQWAHLDIAGVAWLGGDKKGSTGRPVPLLTTYLISRSEEAR